MLRWYACEMLWLIAAQLSALIGEEDFPVPDALSLMDGAPDADTPEALLRRLKGGRNHA